MKRIILCGHGQMGKRLEAAIKTSCDMELLLIVDAKNLKELSSLHERADLVIDFSNPQSLPALYDYVMRMKCAFLSGTTGYGEQEYCLLQKMSKQVPLMHSANYSLGIAVFEQVLRYITPILENDFDMEIIEAHHNQKIDAPSGTAKLLLEAMDPYHRYLEVNGRSGMCGKRQQEIGVHAIRGGSVAGEHTVLYLGDNETLEIKHTANNRHIFVNGALHASKWLIQQKAGLYDMQDMVGGK